MNWNHRKIKALMSKVDMEVQAFAAKLGVTPPTVYNWLSGRTKPTRAHCKLIERTFGGKMGQS